MTVTLTTALQATHSATPCTETHSGCAGDAELSLPLRLDNGRTKDSRMDRPQPHDSQPTQDELKAMYGAIARARTAYDESGKAGIAATIQRNGKVVATGENEVHLQSDPSRHAEIVAIARATAARDDTDQSGCVLISTLQPCEMCLAAMRFAGIARVIFAATRARVAAKYFVFGQLSLTDFQNAHDFTAIGGVAESTILELYVDDDA